MKRSTALLALVVGVAFGAGVGLFWSPWLGRSVASSPWATPYRMMNSTLPISASSGWRSGMGGMMGGEFSGTDVVTVSPSEADSTIRKSLVNSVIDRVNDMITYRGKNVTIALLGSPNGEDEKFVVDGLINPTLHVPLGATVTLELINADDGMPHGVLIAPTPPPYSFMGTMMVGTYASAIIPVIPAATATGYPTATAAFVTTQLGTYFYLCQYPGHAEKGMYGRIIVG